MYKLEWCEARCEQRTPHTWQMVFNLHITYNLNIMETVGIHIENMITSWYYHHLHTFRSHGHHNCLSALMLTRELL